MLTDDQIRHWIEAYGKAWRDKDADAVAALFTHDALYLSKPTEPPHKGQEGIRRYWRQATRTQRDLDLRFGDPIVAGNRAAVEWWAIMRDPDWGPRRPDDAVTLPGCLLLRFTPRGLCAELREYWNAEFGRRVTPPPGWGNPALSSHG
jgi:uncharacterized protein (TIGR02246 family)